MTNDKVLELARKHLIEMQAAGDTYFEGWPIAIQDFAAAIEAECSKELAAAQAEIKTLQMTIKTISETSEFIADNKINEAIANAIEPYKHDAERYRWLRVNSTQPKESWSTHRNPESLDDVIDESMSIRARKEE